MNGMGGYVGSSADHHRISKQQKEREQQRKQFEDAKKKAEAAGGLRQFGTGTSENFDNAFKNETVGLVTRDEFLVKRQTIAERLEAEAKRQRDAAEEDAWKEREERRAKRSKKERKHKLSFDDDFGEDDEEECDIPSTAPPPQPSTVSAPSAPDAAAPPPPTTTTTNNTIPIAATTTTAQMPRKYATLGKDPTVNADFLPDRDREREEEHLRETLRKEWNEQQAKIKAQPLDVTYSYFNGSGHRRRITIKKGDSIGTFLKAVIEQLGPHFRELRGSSASSLMYIKEDVILPQTMTFYELITKKAMGKTGPLFHFQLQEMAATTFDPRMKSQDSHAGKVVERHWYSRNKHIFPYSKWEPFDIEKHFPSIE